MADATLKRVLAREHLSVPKSTPAPVAAPPPPDGASSVVELRLDLDPEAGDLGWLGLRGHGLLDRRVLGIAVPAATHNPPIRLSLAVRARQAGSPYLHPEEQASTCTTSIPG